MTNHAEQTPSHDLAAFEGDWWLLIEEEELEHTPEQRWTLRDGRVFHLGEDVGSASFEAHCLIINTITLGAMRFHPHPAAPLAYLQGNTEDGEFPTYCTFMRVEEPSAGASQHG
ncbi:hypothetical protein [Sphingomonas endolithica]|uniref:hypothetical protein n=1 Tax=Sphingomonas endolithica TaxID=2972485 RepID=UPI0021B06AC6|nr:hypothetical protein [Sphingomonas sp. ZFBP2030]